MKPRVGISTSDRAVETGYLTAVDRDYVDAVAQAGGLPILLPTLSPLDAHDCLAGVDALLLTGGGDLDPSRYGAARHAEVYGVDERRDDWELALAVAAVAAGVPVLAICRGAQVVNVALGGSLVQHLPELTDVAHRVPDRRNDDVHVVDVAAHTRLAAITGGGRLAVNSLHHQAASLIGSGLVVVATAEDGTVEALEGADGRRIVAVQWHPELLAGTSPAHAALFDWLVAEAAEEITPAVV